MSDRGSVTCNSCKREMVPHEHTNVYGWVTGHTCPLCGALWYSDAEARKREFLDRYYWRLIVSSY